MALVARPVVADEERGEIAARKMVGLSPTVDYRLVDGAPAAVASADAIAVFQDDDDDDDGGAVTTPLTRPAAPAVTLPDTGVGPAAPATGADLGAIMAAAGVALVPWSRASGAQSARTDLPDAIIRPATTGETCRPGAPCGARISSRHRSQI